MDLTQDYFKGLWHRKDSKANYRFYKSVVNATLNGQSKAMYWSFKIKNHIKILTIAKNQFKIIEHSDKHFVIETKGKKIVFDRIIET